MTNIFNSLYNNDVISEQGFEAWLACNDPAEELGKGVASKSTTHFFTWMRENDIDDEDDEIISQNNEKPHIDVGKCQNYCSEDSGRKIKKKKRHAFRLNDRFKFSTSLKSRLGEREEEQYDSGDSLERDTGADLGKI